MKSALIKLHIAVFLWGFTGVLGKLITLNEGLLVWWRILFTLTTLLVILFFTQQLQKPNTKTITRLMLVGIVIATHWVFFYGSIKYSNVSIGLICLSTISLFTSVLEPLLTRAKFSFISVLLSLLGVVGIALIFHFDNQYRTGIFLGIISSFFSALFTTFNKKVIETSNTPSQVVMFYELLGGFIFISIILPFYLHFFPSNTLIPNATNVIWLLSLSWICTIVAMFLSLESLKKVTAFTQNLTLNLEPVYGILLAFLLYNEHKYLHHTFYWGLLLIILSVVLQMFRIARE